MCVYVCAPYNILLPAEWSFFRFLLNLKASTVKTNRDLSAFQRLQNVHVSPMMINTLTHTQTPEKVPVYLFDVCDHIPS